MDAPSLSNTQAVFQAGTTIHTYFHQAIKIIDDEFGGGYAKGHPELLAGCIQAQSLDFSCCALTAALYDISRELSEMTSPIAEAIHEIGNPDGDGDSIASSMCLLARVVDNHLTPEE